MEYTRNGSGGEPIPATEKQIEMLVLLGVNPVEAASMTLEDARDLIGHLRSKATPKQVQCLIRNGVPESIAQRYTADEAHEFIAQVAKKQKWPSARKVVR